MALLEDRASQGTHILRICQIKGSSPTLYFWKYGRWRKCNSGHGRHGFVLVEGTGLGTDTIHTLKLNVLGALAGRLLQHRDSPRKRHSSNDEASEWSRAGQGGGRF